MPNKESDPNFNNKKQHIGNDYVTIVYNNSGKPYNLNTIKVIEKLCILTHVNLMVIVKQPLTRLNYISMSVLRLIN